MTDEKKVVVCISEMARMVGLSRARFYQLIDTTFPAPLRDPETGRPFYDEALQQTCLDVRKRNCGIDGRPLMFYARRIQTPAIATKPAKRKITAKPQYTEVVEGLKSLGLVTVSTEVVHSAIKELFPKWEPTQDQGEVLRAVFLHLKRQDSSGNVG